jgi:D-alanine-D-alanine ligase
MRKRIALIYGGNSSEAGVSVKSGKNMAGHLNPEKFEVYEILVKGIDWRVVNVGEEMPAIDKSDFSFVMPGGEKINFDLAFIMIHGTPGEDGMMQGYFDMVGVKYTTCPSIVSAITFNKYACKCFLRDSGVKLPKEVFLRRGDVVNIEAIVDKLGLPLFVKPNDGGSSFGVTKVKDKIALAEAVEEAFKEDDRVIIEEFIAGREMTNGAFLHGEELTVLPVTEIISDNEFFDYEAKYLGASKEICPAVIPDSMRDEIKDNTARIYRHLGCRGIVRVDYIVNDAGIYFLEINTVPGMTEMSLVPQQVRAAGMTIDEFLDKLLS